MLSEVQGDVLVEPGADVGSTCCHIWRKKKHKNRSPLRETQNAEQLDILRKTLRLEQDAPNTSSSSTMHVSLEYLASGERPDRPEPVLVQNSSHVDDKQNSALDRSFYEMDGRESRYIKEVLDWHR